MAPEMESEMNEINEMTDMSATADGRELRQPGYPQLIQKVAFGLGAAVLAGAVVVAIPAATPARAPGSGLVLTSVSLSAAINDVGADTPLTTCCGTA
jgi:hypothetical protein